jgi:hypothetical protein
MSAKIAQALHEVMSAVGYVQKTGKNAFHGYKYAGEADLLEKLRPAMLKAGLLLIPSVADVSPIDEHGVTTVRMEYTLVHKDGDIWPHKIGAAGQGGDKNKGGVGDKGLYKAITGANKYLLFKLFQIETGDDPEAAEAFVPPKTQANVADDGDESRARFIAGCSAKIKLYTDPAALRAWWGSDNQKAARRDFELSKSEIDGLLAEIKTKLETLEGKKAA